MRDCGIERTIVLFEMPEVYYAHINPLFREAVMSSFFTWLCRHWWRGFQKMGAIFMVIYWPLLFPFLLASSIDRSFPWDSVWLVLTYIVFAAPLLISWGNPTQADREDSHRRQSEWFEATLLQLGEKAGVDWQGHLTTRIDALLAPGRENEALRLYRQQAGKTWDEAYLALDNWSKTCPHGPSVPTRLQLRVTTLAAQLDKSKTNEGCTAIICKSAVG
jgi:hypothetical protein